MIFEDELFSLLVWLSTFNQFNFYTHLHYNDVCDWLDQRWISHFLQSIIVLENACNFNKNAFFYKH